MSKHALAAVLGTIGAFVGIWIANALTGNEPHVWQIAFYSVLIGIGIAVVAALFRSRYE
jgi:uncharacterized membrane protein YeaQ/YmgE (transglycosylase-associated protein family)